MELTKKPYWSKTLWLNAAVAICALFYPPASKWMSENVEIVMSVFTGLNMILRLTSNQKLSFF